MSTRVVKFACPTSGTPGSHTTDHTYSGIGTITGAYINVGGATSAGSRTAHAVMSFGAFAGSNQYAAGYVGEDAQTDSDTSTVVYDGHAVVVLDSTGAIVARASAAAITDGIRLTWHVIPSSAYLGSILLFAGDWTCAVEKWDVDTTTTTQNLTLSSGVSADGAITVRPGNNSSPAISTSGTIVDGASVCLSLWDGTDGVSQSSAYPHALTTGQTVALHRPTTGDANALRQNANNATEYQATLTTWVDGCTVGYSGSGGNHVGFTFQFAWTGTGSKSVKAWEFTTATSTGTSADTTPQFEPGAIVVAVNPTTSAGTQRGTANDSQAFGMASQDDAGGSIERGFGIEGEDAAADTVCKTTIDERGLENPDLVQGATRATVNSWDTLGLTWNYTAVSGTACNGIALAIEDVPVSSGVTGTFAGTLPVPTMDSSGYLWVTGPLAGDLPVPTMDAAGSADNTGAMAASLPLLTMAAVGTNNNEGAVAGSLPVPTMSAAGLSSNLGAMAASLPLLTMEAAGVASNLGALAGDLPIPTMDAAGIASNAGAFAGSLPVPTMSAAGVVENAGALAGTLPLLTMAAVGVVPVGGPLAGTLPVPTMSASGVVENAGALAGSLPVPAMSASGVVANAGVLVGLLPLPTMSAAGVVENAGAFAGTLPLLTMSALGTVENAGAFASSLPIPTLVAVGVSTEDVTGTLAATLPLLTMSATGVLPVVGTLGGNLTVPTMSAAGYVPVHGPLAGTLPVPTMAAVGSLALDVTVVCDDWSVQQLYAACDQWRVRLTGPSADNVRARLSMRWRDES